MKNKIEKQVAKKQRKEKSKLRKWWRNNDYKVWRVLLFWIWVPMLVLGKREHRKFKTMRYSEEATQKYLDKVLPYLVSHWREESNCFLFTDAGDFGGIQFRALMSLPRRYRKQERYFIKFYQEVKAFIVRTYQVDGYDKFKILTYSDWQVAEKKFDWGGTPYHDDVAKGVVFYK